MISAQVSPQTVEQMWVRLLNSLTGLEVLQICGEVVVKPLVQLPTAVAALQ